MITLNLEKGSGAGPLYTQLYERIKELIIAKELPAGERLPSKRALASHLHVSIKTVENAYFQLQLEGYIRSKEKVGFFVSNLDGFYAKQSAPKPFVSHYKEEEYRLDVKANRNDLATFPISAWSRIAREIISEKGTELLEVVPFNGVAELRVAIARYLHEFRGMDVSPDQIVVGSGTEYLYGRIVQLLGKDCVIGMEDPGYGHIKKILSVDNVAVRPIPVDASGIRVTALAKSDCTAVHVSPMHHFPLGFTMPIQRRVELLQWANAQPGRYIVEDDYNCEFLYQGNPIQSLFQLDVKQKVIYMNTFSKTVAPSVRVAYMVLPQELMDRYVNTMSFYSCTVTSLIQYQLARFIDEGFLERYIHRVRQRNVQQRKVVVTSLEKHPISARVRLLPNPAGTHFLIRLNTNRSDTEILEGLEERGIHASFVSQCCERRIEALDSMLIVNYSRITPEGMELLLDSLAELI